MNNPPLRVHARIHAREEADGHSICRCSACHQTFHDDRGPFCPMCGINLLPETLRTARDPNTPPWEIRAQSLGINTDTLHLPPPTFTFWIIEHLLHNGAWAPLTYLWHYQAAKQTHTARLNILAELRSIMAHSFKGNTYRLSLVECSDPRTCRVLASLPPITVQSNTLLDAR